MKHLKLLEEIISYFSERIYWAVNNEPRRLRYQLEKLDCPENIILDFLNKAKNYTEEILFVGVKIGQKVDIWTLSNKGKHFDDYKFEGPVKFSKKFLDKIDLEDETDKYNL